MSAAFDPAAVERFRYVGYGFDPAGTTLECRYALDDLEFTERVTFDAPAGDLAEPAAIDGAARLVFLLAGISAYKAAAPPVIDVGDHGLSAAERALLDAFYRDGLGEYAHRNDLDLSGVRIEAADRTPPPVPTISPSRRALVPFGGGIDSIVTVEGVRAAAADAALFVVSRTGDRFDAIEAPAAVTELPVVRAARAIDPKLLRSGELGFRNGHVPVTGILSAIAVLAAVLDDRDAVVMSNEWSASAGNVAGPDGRVVNHQWSKSLEFEDLFRAAVAEAVGGSVDYFSWLRPFSELWVAHRFAALAEYHPAFRSCNRSFAIDRARRLDHWCGTCDKCCFIDLILAPYLPASTLAAVFGGREPLDDPVLAARFEALCGVSDDPKPFECVGDTDECRVAALVAAGRDDAAARAALGPLAAAVAPLVGDVAEPAARLLRPMGPHRIPDAYAPADLVG